MVHLLKWRYQPEERQTGLPLATLPETCPWTVAQVLDADFWPET